jgi:hypothetical protein
LEGVTGDSRSPVRPAPLPGHERKDHLEQQARPMLFRRTAGVGAVVGAVAPEPAICAAR